MSTDTGFPTRYYVESATKAGTYMVNSPEAAVQSFFAEYDLMARTAKVRVSVIDFIGEFSQETRVIRHPRQTKPDSPHALTPSQPPP
jgi:hypothetical protein